MIRIALLLLMATSAAHAQDAFPTMPPCGRAFVFEPTAAGGTVQFDQVTVPGLNAPAGPFTLEAWVNYRAAEGTTAWPDGFHTIAAFGEINQGDRPLLAVRHGALELWTGTSRVRGGAVPLGQWTHVAYTWDGTTNRLYVNGTQAAANTNAPTLGGTSFYIGYSRGNTGWNGQIDEVAVWTEARTAEEVAADARGVRTGEAAGLYAYFKFDDLYYDIFTGEPFAFNEADPDVRGVLGWTQDYPTGRPVAEAVRTPGPAGAEVLSCRLHTPLDLVVRDDFLEISDTGTGQGDGAVLGYRVDSGVDPSAWTYGLASEIGPEGGPSGTNGLGHDAQGRSLVLQGTGSGPDARTLLVFDRSRGQNDALVATHDIGQFVLGRGFAESNPYRVVVGPEDDFFVVDAAANAIVRIEDQTGYMSVFATFEPVPNRGTVGPPVVDAVPTGLAFDGTQFYVSAFTGFPFAEDAARLYTVSLDGRVALFRTELTTAIDVDLDPRDDRPVVLEFARADGSGAFVPGTGRILKLYPGAVDTLATGLTLPTALAHGADGTLYVTTLGGQLLRYEAGSALDVDNPAEVPAAFALEPAYPNPFNPATQVRFTLAQAQPVRLMAYDVLGRAVALLAEGVQPAGTHTFTWDAAGLPSGTYLLRLETPTGAAVRHATLLK